MGRAFGALGIASSYYFLRFFERDLNKKSIPLGNDKQENEENSGGGGCSLHLRDQRGVGRQGEAGDGGDGLERGVVG